MCTLAQLVKPTCSIRGDLGLNPDGNVFFLVYVTKLPILILAVSIFRKLSEYCTMDYRNAFLNYWTIGISNIGPES